MAVAALATPKTLSGPGFMFIAPVGSALPTHASAGGKFTDTITTPWLALGATAEGTEFSYSTEVAPIEVAEFFDPISYETTGRSGNVTFALASYTLTNVRRAFNGGAGAVVATGTAGAEVTTLSPPTPGTEVRVALLWESFDNSLRLHLPQVIQGGDVSMAFRKAPDLATIPVTFNLEVPASGQPWTLIAAGTARVA
jgi:hypothetical protein